MSEIDFTPGRWAVVKGSSELHTQICEIQALGPTTISGSLGQKRRYPKTSVLATFTTDREARHFCQSVDGIRGEMERRINAARQWADKALGKKMEAARG